MASYAVIFAVTALSALISTVCVVELDVNTTSGFVRGKSDKYEGREVIQFLSVPYAEPPVGDLRFKPPVMKSRMDDTYNATSISPICPQNTAVKSEYDRLTTLNFTRLVDENCLYLNIYVPSDAQQLPVMVWIHGGAYVVASAIYYDGTVLVALNDVIVVTLNYRLGALGFLDTEDEHSVGNFGLRDQILALRWIKSNIEHFGGNVSSITVFGESAGAGCVSQIAMSPDSEGLFHRMIVQSGSPFAPRSSLPSPRKTALAFGNRIGCPTGNRGSLLDCLRAKTVQEILGAQFPSQSTVFLAPWAPSYDGTFIPFGPDQLDEMLTSDTAKRLAKIDLLIGLNEQEGTLFYNLMVNTLRVNGELNDTVDGISEEFFQSSLGLALDALPPSPLIPGGIANAKRFLEIIDFQYTDWKEPDNSIARLIMLIKVMSDTMFNAGSVRFARLHGKIASAEHGSSYFYHMRHRGSWMTDAPWVTGADHGDDVFFMFGFPFSRPDLLATDEEKTLSRRMMTFWANFAKSGNPNEPITAGLPTYWPAYDMDTETFIRLDTWMTTQSTDTRIFTDRMAFWLKFLPKVEKRPIPKQMEFPKQNPTDGSSRTGALPYIGIVSICLFNIVLSQLMGCSIC